MAEPGQEPEEPEEPEDLEDLLDRMGEAESDEDGRVSMDAMLDAIGHRSFGPLLLLTGLVTVAPLIGDIPGVPTIMAAIVVLTAGQLLLRRDHIWLPGWILRRNMEREKLRKAGERLRKPARAIDRWVRPRLTHLVQGPGAYAVAAACILIALGLPAMEFIPFSANLAGAALTAFGLALIARDGVLGLMAFAVTAGAIGVVLYNVI